MSTYIGGKQHPLEKAMMVVVSMIFIAFLIALPFMMLDKQDRLNKAWQEQGCHMYDNERIANIPSKCHGYFIDHYAPQERRQQP